MKNDALMRIAALLRERAPQLLEANAADVAAARDNGLDAAMIDRLTLTAKGVAAMATGLEQVAALPDPVGDASPAPAAGANAQAARDSSATGTDQAAIQIDFISTSPSGEGMGRSIWPDV